MSWPPDDSRLAVLAAELGIPDDYPVRRGLPHHPEAKDLIVAAIAPDDRTEVRLSPLAAAAWAQMEAAARADDLVLWPISGFRSVERQAAIIRAKLKQGQAISEILQLMAAPGFSEHHSGRALDIGTPGAATLDESFGETAEFRWLERRASEFGFSLSYPRGNAFGIGYEPWHWCWTDAKAR